MIRYGWVVGKLTEVVGRSFESFVYFDRNNSYPGDLNRKRESKQFSRASRRKYTSHDNATSMAGIRVTLDNFSGKWISTRFALSEATNSYLQVDVSSRFRNEPIVLNYYPDLSADKPGSSCLEEEHPEHRRGLRQDIRLPESKTYSRVRFLLGGFHRINPRG